MMCFAQSVVPVRLSASGANKGDLDLLHAAAGLSSRVTALFLGSETESFALRGSCHACLVAEGSSRPEAGVLAELLREHAGPGTLVLMRHDSFGMDAGPGTAVLLSLPFVSNIHSLVTPAPGVVLVRRSENNGQQTAEYRLDAKAGALFTVVPGGFSDTSPPPACDTVFLSAAAPDHLRGRRIFLEEIEPPAASVHLESAQVLVALGRGAGGADIVPLAARLASQLSGELCCSRAVADAGWMDKERQVGISGQSVSPAKYLAFGVHGSFQHMAGIQGTPFIAAVNKNPDAPIFQYADVGIIADAPTFIPILSEALGKKEN